MRGPKKKLRERTRPRTRNGGRPIPFVDYDGSTVTFAVPLYPHPLRKTLATSYIPRRVCRHVRTAEVDLQEGPLPVWAPEFSPEEVTVDSTNLVFSWRQSRVGIYLGPC